MSNGILDQAGCWVDYLVEHPVEAVLVVDNGGHKGQHQAPAPTDLCVPVTVLHVLPAAGMRP